MKKAKAIDLLKLAVPIKALTQQEYSDFVEAVNMGMDALEQPTSPDTIDRKAALDALARTAREKFNLSDEFNHYLAGLMDGELAIKELPTIQPEERTEERTETHVCDLISRQQAIRWVKTECNPYGKRNAPRIIRGACCFELFTAESR